MKKLIFALTLLISVNSFASGKISTSANYFTLDKKMLPQVGLSIYEDTGFGFAIDSYLGTGVSTRHNFPDVYWWVARADIAVPVTDDVTVSAGATLRLSEQEWIGVEDESNIHVRASFKLWE